MSKLAVFSALAIFLMVADSRFKVMQPLRAGLAAVLYPAQWLALQPVQWVQGGGDYFSTVHTAQAERDLALTKLGMQAQRANQVDQLTLENERLRKLLGLRERLQSPATPAQLLYDAADPYTRKVIIDKGSMSQPPINLASPVLDEHGVLGQVTRVYPWVSEVTLIVDRDHATPVMNARTGARGVVFGDVLAGSEVMELRFMAANADVLEGDLLTTSGVDGVYPPGLPVARIEKIERLVDKAFARIYGKPLALVAGSAHVMVLELPANQLPTRSGTEAQAALPLRRGDPR